MRRFDDPLYWQSTRMERRVMSGTGGSVEREAVPAFIDALDCLLAVWVAEAALDALADSTDANRGPVRTGYRRWDGRAGANGGEHCER